MMLYFQLFHKTRARTNLARVAYHRIDHPIADTCRAGFATAFSSIVLSGEGESITLSPFGVSTCPPDA